MLIHHFYTDDTYELYNLKNDIGETRDLSISDPANFSQGLRDILVERYPHDKAVDYQKGDSRGAFSVIFNYPDANVAINKILSENGR